MLDMGNGLPYNIHSFEQQEIKKWLVTGTLT
jgi:hypothetical protein